MVSARLEIVLFAAVAATASVAALGGAAGAPQSPPPQGAPAVSIALDPVAGEHVRGRATLAASGTGTSAQLSLAGLPPGARARVRLHAGSCASPDRLGASFALVATVTANPAGRARSANRISYRGRDAVQLSALTDGDHVIVVVLDRGVGVAACGRIPRLDASPIVFATAAGIPDIAVRDGAVVERLTRNDWYEGLPAWSPDRRRIAYVSARNRDADIWVMNADGSGARRLAGARRADDLYPAWSPDGTLLAFARYEHGSGHIYVMRSDGTGLRRLTNTPTGVVNTMPRFSPDGRHIVLASTRRSGAHELVRVRASDGGGATFLTRGGNAFSPDYSTDGSRLVFATSAGSTVTLWTMRADGRHRRILTRHANRNLSLPRFSPDGRFVLYTVTRPADEQTESRLWRIGADGSGRMQIGRGAEGDW